MANAGFLISQLTEFNNYMTMFSWRCRQHS